MFALDKPVGTVKVPPSPKPYCGVEADVDVSDSVLAVVEKPAETQTAN